jgi:hypothetical protein
MYANHEETALTAPDIGDAVAPDVVESRALSAPQTRWCFGREGQLECPLEDVDHPLVLVLVVDLDAAAGAIVA